MFYIPRTQPYYQPEYYPYPYAPPRRRPTSWYDDNEEDYENEHDDYVETKRCEYLDALHQHQRREYEHAVVLENQRHRAQLAALAERESLRKRRSPSHSSYDPYGYERPHLSALEEPVRHRQPAPKDWQTRLLEQVYGIPTGYVRQQRERSDEEQVPYPELEEQREPVHPRTARRPIPPRPQTQARPQATPKPHLQPRPVRVPISSPTHSDSESDSPKRTQALTAIAEIAHTFDILHRTFVFPSGPLERNPHSSTPRLAFNAQNSPVHAYENALSELLTKLDAVESHGSKAVRDARKELVVKIERELEELEKKVINALRAGEEDEVEEKVEQTNRGEEVAKEVVEDLRAKDHPAATPTEASEVPEVPAVQDEHMETDESSQPQDESSQPQDESSQPQDESSQPQAESVLSMSITTDLLPTSAETQTIDQITEPGSAPNPADAPSNY